MQAYREGATGMDVLQKTKAIKKSHRVPLLLEQQPREAYSRNRGQRVARILAGMEGEGESDEEGARGGRLREGGSEITFDQEEFAGLMSQYLKRCVNGQAWGWANIGRTMRNRVRLETPKVDYLVGQLFFDEIVKDRRLEDDRERDTRERIEFGLFGDMAAVTFGNGENVVQENED